MKVLILIAFIVYFLAVMTNSFENRPNSYTSTITQVCKDICK